MALFNLMINLCVSAIHSRSTNVYFGMVHLSRSFRKIRTTMGTSRILLIEDQFNLTSCSAFIYLNNICFDSCFKPNMLIKIAYSIL